MRVAIAFLFYSVMLSHVFGAWTLIDDFQQWSDGDIITDPTTVGWNSVSTYSDAYNEFWMLADPYDPTNIGMYVYTGMADQRNALCVSKELPDGGIPPGETGTVYFRCLFTGYQVSWYIGTADKPLAFDPETGAQTAPGGSWADFNAKIRVSDAFILEHRDGDGYVSTNPPVSLQTNNWYQFFLIVENTWDESTVPPTSTGVYTLYVQGPGVGDGISPYLVPVGTDPPKNSASLQRAPVDDAGNPQPIRWLMLATDNWIQLGCPSCGDTFVLDDLYFSPGANTITGGDPPEWWWGYYFANSDRDVDTEAWMGWLNTYSAPYIWSYLLNGWIYMNRVEESGAWGYFYK